MLKLWKKYLKPYKWLIVFALIIITAKSIANLLIPDLLKNVVNLIPLTPNVSAPIKDMFIQGGIALLAVFGVIVGDIIVSYLSSKIAFSFGADLRKKVFKHTQNLSQVDFEKIGTASLITRTINDITQLEQVTMLIIRMMIAAPIMLIGGSIMAFRLDVGTTLVILGALPILIMFIAFIGLKIVPLYKKMQKGLDALTLTTKENITGVRVIRAFNNEELEREKFDLKNKTVTKLATSANHYMAFTFPFVSFIFSIVTLLIIWFGATGSANLANINAVIQYGMRIMMSFLMLVMMFIFIPRASASATRINEVLNLKSNIKEVKKSKSAKKNAKGTLTFKNVGFKFEDAEEPTLHNINFEATKGQTFAIVGGTGSGKSTILNLMPRFYDVTEGEILIDGVNIKNYTLKDLRKKISVVPQRSTMFNKSILENITYSNKKATLKDAKEASKIAQAYDFIMEKGGFNSKIEKGGANLSGGQKQRLSIARAIVKKPDIYLFDDSFSALDLKTDSKLRKELKKVTKNAITIIVAQRISTIQNADKILVLDEGNIVGIGTHKQLLENCTTYKEIYYSQNKKEVK